MTQLAGKRIVVTGAARGIGAMLAAELVARGATVIGADISDGCGVQCDVSDPDQVDALFAKAGAVDGVVNNAALLVHRRAHDEIDLDEWDRMFAVNVRGSFLCARAGARAMDGRGGSIVNVASETAFTGSHGFVHYVASKGAVMAMTRALANELGPKGIRVNCVAPGFTPTPLRAARRLRLDPHAAGAHHAPCRPPRDVLLPPVRRRRLRLRPNHPRQRRPGPELNGRF